MQDQNPTGVYSSEQGITPDLYLVLLASWDKRLSAFLCTSFGEANVCSWLQMGVQNRDCRAHQRTKKYPVCLACALAEFAICEIQVHG